MKPGGQQDNTLPSPPSAGFPGNIRRPSPAHRGAIHAFLQASKGTEQATNTYSNKNEALAAASVGFSGRREALEPGDGFLPADRTNRAISRPPTYGNASKDSTKGNASSRPIHALEQSPSRAAAALAPARATAPPDSGINNLWLRHERGEASESDIALDATSTPGTGSLSHLYESRQLTTPLQRSMATVLASRDSDGNGQVPLITRTPGITRSADNHVPQLSVDSLANAMVASSLASSRASSPIKPVPPPPRRQGKPHLFHRNHSQELVSRTPSPAKGMRQTMREPQKPDHPVEHARKFRLMRQHPNKHHEGDRKRYRTQVTERERKRYEGVWAANKGLLLPNASENAVLNIVVRDIWRRSRLPDDVLEEVWDIVNPQNLDILGKEEFVVGMFLIDQRLQGNKLPVNVPASLWSSVRRLDGIKAPKDRR
ncbi:MAG: hypothetical protein Q9163_004783 [Psora crenata]